jgi:hypothetical protein
MCPKGSRTGAKRKRRSRPRVLASEQIVSEQRPGRRATLRGRRSQAPRPARWQQAAPQCPRPDAISASRRPRSRRSTGCLASITGSPLRRREKVLRATSRPAATPTQAVITPTAQYGCSAKWQSLPASGGRGNASGGSLNLGRREVLAGGGRMEPSAPGLRRWKRRRAHARRRFSRRDRPAYGAT